MSHENQQPRHLEADDADEPAATAVATASAGRVGDELPEDAEGSGPAKARSWRNMLNLINKQHSKGSLTSDLDDSEQKRSVFEVEWQNVLEISCEKYGRSYYIKAASSGECNDWIAAVLAARDGAIQRL